MFCREVVLLMMFVDVEGGVFMVVFACCGSSSIRVCVCLRKYLYIHTYIYITHGYVLGFWLGNEKDKFRLGNQTCDTRA